MIKYAPFADQNEDRLGMVASLQLLLMLIGAFALKTDDKESGTYDGVVIATSLMIMNIGVFVLGVWTIIYAFPDAKSGIDNCLRKCCKNFARCFTCCCRKKKKVGKLSSVVENINLPTPGKKMKVNENGNKYKVKNDNTISSLTMKKEEEEEKIMMDDNEVEVIKLT